jgi:hypothetical protein
MWVIMGSFKDGSWMPELRRGFADSLEAWGGESANQNGDDPSGLRGGGPCARKGREGPGRGVLPPFLALSPLGLYIRASAPSRTLAPDRSAIASRTAGRGRQAHVLGPARGAERELPATRHRHGSGEVKLLSAWLSVVARPSTSLLQGASAQAQPPLSVSHRHHESNAAKHDKKNCAVRAIRS